MLLHSGDSDASLCGIAIGRDYSDIVYPEYGLRKTGRQNQDVRIVLAPGDWVAETCEACNRGSSCWDSLFVYRQGATST